MATKKLRKPPRRRKPAARSRDVALRQRSIDDRLQNLKLDVERIQRIGHELADLRDSFEIAGARVVGIENRIAALENAPDNATLAREVLAIKGGRAVNEHFHERLLALEQDHRRLAAEVNQLRIFGRRDNDREQLEQIAKSDG
jgi:hypothetical protein